MKVHFGGSSAGFNDLKGNYVQIRSNILMLGHKIVRDWTQPEVIAKTATSQDAHEATQKAIKESDAIIIEASYDSSGVGQQLLMATENDLPTLILISENHNGKNFQIGNFVKKDAVKLVRRSFYNAATLREVLVDFFAWASQLKKYSRFNLVLENNLDAYLKLKARVNLTSKTEEIKKLIIKDMKATKRKNETD